jgi:hypothetical protein
LTIKYILFSHNKNSEGEKKYVAPKYLAQTPRVDYCKSGKLGNSPPINEKRELRKVVISGCVGWGAVF